VFEAVETGENYNNIWLLNKPESKKPDNKALSFPNPGLNQSRPDLFVQMEFALTLLLLSISITTIEFNCPIKIASAA
jgi:hypothetical protein